VNEARGPARMRWAPLSCMPMRRIPMR
jgi:hypothetical protein